MGPPEREGRPVHLLYRGRPACDPTITTRRVIADYRKVTCVPCSGSIHMADAEARAQLNRRD